MTVEVREITSRGEWLAWRSECITASRVAALFSAHPYLTPEQLAAEMAGKSQGDSPAMRAGRILEPGIAVALSEDNPSWHIVKATTFHIDTELRFGCTPDFFLDDDGLIQAKTVSPEVWEEWHGQPPLAYKLQTLSEMMLTGRTRGILAVMVRSRSYPVHCFDVPRHEAAERRIMGAVADWWKNLDSGKIAHPALSTGLDAALDDGSHKNLSGDNLLPALLEKREELKATVGASEKELKQIDAEIRERIGAARTAWLPGWSLRLPTINVKEHLVSASSYRRLTVSRAEE